MTPRKLNPSAAVAILATAVLFSAAALADDALPRQPQLGFEGRLVDVSKYVPGQPKSLGMQVDSIKRNTPAWKMGLEKGDVIVSIDTWRFNTVKGYRQALRAAGQRPSIIIIDGRTKKLVRRPCNLPHAVPDEKDLTAHQPDSYQMGITLEDDIKQNAP